MKIKLCFHQVLSLKDTENQNILTAFIRYHSMARHECSHWKFTAPLQTAPLVTHTWQKPYTPQAICPWDQVSSINKLTRNRSAESLQGAQQFALPPPNWIALSSWKIILKNESLPRSVGDSTQSLAAEAPPSLCSEYPQQPESLTASLEGMPKDPAMIMTPLPWSCFCWEQWSSHGTSRWLEILVLSEREHSCV